LTSAGVFKQSVGARNRIGIELSYRSASVGNLSPAMGRGIDSRNRVWNGVAKLHRLSGRYDNPMPTWFLAPVAVPKLPTQPTQPGIGSLESILGFKNSGSDFFRFSKYWSQTSFLSFVFLRDLLLAPGRCTRGKPTMGKMDESSSVGWKAVDSSLIGKLVHKQEKCRQRRKYQWFSPSCQFPTSWLVPFFSFSSFLLRGSVVILFHISPQDGKYIYF
jgi:hypothetical protein